MRDRHGPFCGDVVKREAIRVWRNFVRLYRLIRDPKACGARANDRTTVGFIPWWPHSFYQSRLVTELGSIGVDVRGNNLSLRSLLCLLLNRDYFDVIHVHWPHGMYAGEYWRFPFVVFHLWVYRLLKNNIIWTVHELDEFYETHYPILDRMMVFFLMKACRQLIVHSNYSAQTIRQRYRYAGKITLLRHPSYVGCYPNDIAREDARAQLGLGKEATVYLFLGRIKPYKGVESLIGTFKAIRDEGSKLIIAGQPFDEETGKRIAALAAADSRILADIRYLPDDRLQDYMNAADVVVFPFRKTHTSGSMQLAMSFGKPVIAPAIASIPEYVDGQSGILFDSTDRKALRAALVDARNKDLQQMGKNALARVAKLKWGDFAENHARLYVQFREHAGAR